MALSPRKKKLVYTMLVVDAIVVIGAGILIYHRVSQNVKAGERADLQVQIRKMEPTLTEIDLTNKGNGPGDFTRNINAHWADSELKDSGELKGFSHFETRHSVVFVPNATDKIHLAPGENRAVGWVKLEDDSPVLADVTDENPATQP